MCLYEEFACASLHTVHSILFGLHNNLKLANMTAILQRQPRGVVKIYYRRLHSRSNEFTFCIHMVARYGILKITRRRLLSLSSIFANVWFRR